VEHKKPPEEPALTKSIFASKASTTDSSNFYKPPEKLKLVQSDVPSRTPPKFLAEKKLDQSVNFSKTPTKYKNVFENPNKNSAIRKGSTDGEEKKTFKSLNEIVECKAR
jgi:hypothetical protein